MAKKEDSKLKTIRLKSDLIHEIQELADTDNRNWNNMAETLLMIAAKQMRKNNLTMGAL